MSSEENADAPKVQPGHESAPGEIGPETLAIYRKALVALTQAEVPFLVGGSYALERYTGISRHSKDFDVFVREQDLTSILAVLEQAGFRTEITFRHWLAKAYRDDDFIDLIYSSGNGLAPVDDEWIVNGVQVEVLGIPARVCPAEEMIWQKAFIMERERYDGADVLHLVRARGEELDWQRLLRRFGEHWRVLLSHLVLFGFVYPAERDRIPSSVMRELLGRLEDELEMPAAEDPRCWGTVVSRAQYLVEVEQWGYQDARVEPNGNMTPEDAAEWTAAMDREYPHLRPHLTGPAGEPHKRAKKARGQTGHAA